MTADFSHMGKNFPLCGFSGVLNGFHCIVSRPCRAYRLFLLYSGFWVGFFFYEVCRNLRDIYCAATTLLSSEVTGGREESKAKSKMIRRRETKAKIPSASFPWHGRVTEEKNSISCFPHPPPAWGWHHC